MGKTVQRPSLSQLRPRSAPDLHVNRFPDSKTLHTPKFMLDIAGDGYDQSSINSFQEMRSIATLVLHLPPLTAIHNDEQKMLQHKTQLLNDFRTNPPLTIFRLWGGYIAPVNEDPVILNDDDRFPLEVAAVETNDEGKFGAGRFVYDVVGERWVRIGFLMSSNGAPYKTAGGASRAPFKEFALKRRLRMKVYSQNQGVKAFDSEPLVADKLQAQREKWMSSRLTSGS